MTTHKGFAGLTVLIAIAVLALIGSGAYVATHPEVVKTDDHMQTEAGDHPEEDHDAMDGMQAGGKIGIKWEFVDAGEQDGIPHTRVMLNGHHIGDYEGTCAEVGAEGGVDGKGLLTGEVAAAQCWFAGGGDEIGVFGNEDGGLDVMTGELQEPSGEGEAFRGNFKMNTHLGL